MKKVLLTVLAALTIVSCNKYGDEISDINHSINSLRTQLTDDNADLAGEIAALSTEIALIRQQISSDNTVVLAQLDDLEDRLADIQWEFNNLASNDDVSNLHTAISGLSLDVTNIYLTDTSTTTVNVETPDVNVDVDAPITVVDPPSDTATDTTDDSDEQAGTNYTYTFDQLFGGVYNPGDDSTVFAFPAAAEDWAGFAQLDPETVNFQYGGKYTITVASASNVEARFRFERLPHPDVDPSFNVDFTINGAGTYEIDIPAQDAANTYASHLFYLITRDQAVTITNFTLTVYTE